MAIRELMGTFIDKAGGLQEIIEGKVNEWLDEYKKTIAILETFGFAVGMGLLPEIHTSISGSIENIREDALHKTVQEHQSEPLLVGLLNSLVMARRFWQHVELKLTSVTLDVTLGVPPKINVQVH